MPALLMVAPIAPCATGNGLAMRLAGFVEAAARTYDVSVAVVPVAGHLPGCPRPVGVPVVEVATPGRARLQAELARLVAQPAWRQLLGDTDPVPGPARSAGPALAEAVVRASGAPDGAAVHVFRSYLAPLGLAVAQHLGAPWTSLDLDDDDERLARASGDPDTASAYHRLVAAYGPRYDARCLASPADAAEVGRRHHLAVATVPNAVAVPEAPPARRRRSLGDPAVLLFVANLRYGPNIEAATVLVEGVLDALEADGRAVRVVLVGDREPDGPVDVLGRRPSVTVTGFVDDPGPYYGRADVVVAPIARAGGTCIKVLEAFAHQVPVVTTPAGASGLEVTEAEHLVVVATVAGLARATRTVLDHPDLADRLVRAAFARVRARYATAVVADEVRGLFAAARTARALSARSPRS